MIKTQTHIDEWLDAQLKESLDETMQQVFRFFDFKRSSAMFQAHNRNLLGFKLFAKYESKEYRITGASRLGDIYLSEDPNRDTGYDIRGVYVEDFQISEQKN